MADIQSILNELPFPAVGFTPDGQIMQNKLASEAKVVEWLQDQPPEAIQQFLDNEARSVSRVHCKIGGRAVVASGRWLSCGFSKILRLMPQL